MPIAFRTIATAILTSAILAPAAADEPVSLEKAKEITKQHEGVDFVAPPRSVEDVTAILREQKVSEDSGLEETEAKADRKAPKTKKAKKLAKFYFKRGTTARKIGRQLQALEDFRKAVKHLARTEMGRKFRVKVFKNLAFTELGAGNYRNAIRAMKHAIEVGDDPSTYRGLAKIYAQAGDFRAAAETKEEALASIARRQARADMSKKPMKPKLALKLEREGYEIESLILEIQGKWKEAEHFHRKEIRLLENTDVVEIRQTKLTSRKRMLARNLKLQNRFVEAEVVARDALIEALGKIGSDNTAIADLARELGQILLAQGRHADAEKLARSALDIYRKSGAGAADKRVAMTRRDIGIALAARGDWQAARSEFDAMRDGIAAKKRLAKKMVVQKAAVPITLVKTGSAAEVIDILTPVIEKSEDQLGKKHPNTTRHGVLLAMAETADGRRREGFERFRKFIPYYLARSRQQAEETDGNSGDVSWRTAILETYIGLLADIRGSDIEREAGIDAAEEAFRIAEIARGGVVMRAVAASGARAVAGNPELADLVRREQDARKQVATLYERLADALSASSDQQDADVISDIRVRIDDLRGARSALMEEIEGGFPEYADLINPKPPAFDKLRQSMRDGEALVSFFIGSERSFAWAVPKSGEAAFAAVDLDFEAVSDKASLLRGALEPEAETLGDIPAFDFALAHDLYTGLLKPIEPGFTEAKNLLIVAHGPLGLLPLTLLTTEPFELPADDGLLFAGYRQAPWLLRRHSVTLLPSVSSLSTLRGLPAGRGERLPFAGFGDPFFSKVQMAEAENLTGQAGTLDSRGSDGVTTRGGPLKLRSAPETRTLDQAGLALLPRLPDTATEMLSIASALKVDAKSHVFLNERASEKVVKSTDLSGYRVVAFATHGLVPGDLDGLTQPALALTAPEITGSKEDGLLTMGEILGLRLDADWVVLSACNTAAAEGAEAVSGLGRAFFYAGTRAILVSNWPVHSASAKALTTDLFRRQAEAPNLRRTDALRLAMITMIDGPGFVDSDGQSIFSYAHPLFWAPFSLMGDG